MAKILLIEDNVDILYANKVMLEMEGYTVFGAASAAEGARLAHSENPDLIILDIMLPDGNGIELCNELKREHSFNVIFLSALGTEQTVLDAIKAGGSDFIYKPYLMDDLVSRVNKVLEKVSLGQEDGMP